MASVHQYSTLNCAGRIIATDRPIHPIVNSARPATETVHRQLADRW